MSISAATFAATARRAVDDVIATQRAAVAAAAALVVEGLRAGGVVQAFGTGHSQALAMELAGRAGGLVPTNLILPRDLVLLGGAAPDVLLDPLIERDPAVGARIFGLHPAHPADVYVVASHSGANGAVVEFAQRVVGGGHRLVAVTSMAHTTAVASRHPSGKRLFELADVVLDNGAPYGDAALDGTTVAGEAVTACAVSSITAALLAQMVVAEVVATMIAAGETPPVYTSSNVPGGDVRNEELEARYAGRVRRTA
jgi:uncharacterized phosphosugar-binding protein